MAGKLELCRDRISVTETNAVLGLHSNVAGDDNSYTAGHAWVSIHTDSRTIYLGLWPDGHPRVDNHDPNCSDVRLGLEVGGVSLASRYYELQQHQIQRLNQFINEPTVWRYTQTCAAWAVQVINNVVGASISAVDYILFSTPRQLGKQLLILERKDPSSLLRPAVYNIERNPFWGSLQ